ncbi:MAG: asparagine synthase (glutamine-hydrolyzing) [Thermodesulfobacteriota bacterium]
MCGICGIATDLLSGDEQRAIVGKMNDAMVHRGPDDSGFINLKNVCLGMRRLSIIDLSSAAHQPMSNEDRTIWIVFNGEIYNYQELRSDLLNKNHRFKSLSDTEVLLHLYEEYGLECLDRIRGMFAFAICDAKKQELFIARDRLGIKPLYYIMHAGKFIFSSEIKSILRSGLVEPEPDPEAIDMYLSFGYVPPPWTLLKGIRCLLPGHFIHINGSKTIIKKWWFFPEPDSGRYVEKEIIAGLRDLLEESIKLHQISDVPIGAFLSGGIDSTAVVGLMSRISNRAIKTFSIGFEGDVPDKFNELASARSLARKFGAEHTEVILKAKDVRDELDNVVWFLDQPSFDGINSYFVSRAARQGGLTVALSGLGGDELFGGYGSYKTIPFLSPYIKFWGKVPACIQNSVAKTLRSTLEIFSDSHRIRKIEGLSRVNSPAGLYALARFTLWPSDKEDLYSSFFMDVLRNVTGRIDSFALLDRYVNKRHGIWRMVMELELQAYMNWRLLRDTDVMSMAHSLEVRVPLIDHKIVEFVCRIPTGWERHLGYPKRLFIAALSDIIPEEIINKPKHGFEFPIGYWIKTELKDIVEDAISDHAVKRRGFFSPKAVAALYEEFLKGWRSYPTLWQLVMLELWLRRVVDKN